MKKSKLPVILAIVIIGLGWTIARLTHVLDFYKFATTSNMPGHKPGDWFMASRLKTPDHGDFVCFKNSDTKTTFIFRVIGKANDVIEIKNAVVYRNGQKLNEPYTWNEYKLSQKEYNSIAGYVNNDLNMVTQPNDSTYLVALTDAEVNNYHLKVSRWAHPSSSPDAQLSAQFKPKGYNADNFGPVTVPANSYFLLGDNRHDAMDSRYLGFINAQDIVSTKLGN